MADPIIGNLVLTEDLYAPSVNISHDFFYSNGGEVIGGRIKADIRGNVTSDSQGNTTSGSIVMSRLKGIRNLGKKTGCVNVSIPNFNPLGNKARITNITIDQGSDPSWVNRGEYSISLEGVISAIPENSFGLVASDCVTNIERSESIEASEDSHGYVYDLSTGAAKGFVTFKCSTNLTCEFFCNPGKSSDVLQRVYSTTLRNSVFDEYKSWDKFLKSRSLSMKNDGSIDFSYELILMPKGTNAGALVDLNFEYSSTNDSNDITYRTTGSVEGLVNVNFQNLISLNNSCFASKLKNAQSVFNLVRGKYSDLGEWNGEKLDLPLKEGCPVTNLYTVGQCYADEDDQLDSSYVAPSSSSVSTARVEGKIDFTFEWSTTTNDKGALCVANGIKTEVTVDITDPQETLVEHILPGRGSLIQNLDCKTAKKVAITVSTTYPNNSCDPQSACESQEGLDIAREDYLDGNFILIGHTKTKTNTSDSIKEEYIECR